MRRDANKKYLDIRKSLLGLGYTIRSWALENGHPVTTVYGAARGERGGVKSTRILKQLEAASTARSS